MLATKRGDSSAHNELSLLNTKHSLFCSDVYITDTRVCLYSNIPDHDKLSNFNAYAFSVLKKKKKYFFGAYYIQHFPSLH